MDAVSILSSPTPVTVSEDGTASAGEITQEAKSIVANGTTPTAPVETKVEEKKDEYISPRFAMLAKEEKRLQEERKRLAEERKNPDFQEFLEFKKLKARAKQDPLSLLEKFEVTYDELTDYVISGKHTKDPSVRVLEEKLEKMEREAKEIEREAKEREESAKKALEESQLNQFKEQIKAKCLESADEFELVNIWQAHNLVYSVIQEHYDKTEEVLPITEAAKKVEAYLEKESEKYQGSKKLRKLFGAPDVQAAAAKTEAAQFKEVDTEQRPAAKSMSATLSNNASSGSTSTDEVDEYDPQALLEKAKRLLER